MADPKRFTASPLERTSTERDDPNPFGPGETRGHRSPDFMARFSG
jgi:hypothetical protein